LKLKLESQNHLLEEKESEGMRKILNLNYKKSRKEFFLILFLEVGFYFYFR